jgi:dUTP pyrophosphatase
MSLKAHIPDVIRHTALRSSDFPPPEQACANSGSDRPVLLPGLVYLESTGLTCCRRYHEHMLRVKLLETGARLPVVAHPGEDLGYDVFSLEAVVLEPHRTIRVRTGISVEARHPETGIPLGLLVRDRSSMASKGIATTAGVIDAGYRGEVQIVMTNLGAEAIEIKAGEKIAQMIPVPVLTGPVQEVEALEESARLGKGFGSSGR